MTGVRRLDSLASIVVLFALAVAQPLLDLLGRNAEFFLARSSPPVDIVVLAVLLAFIIPTLVGLAALGIIKIHEPTGRIVHGAILAILGAILALQIINATPLSRLAGAVEITLASAIGVAIVIGFYQYEALRLVGRYAAIAPFAIFALFLFFSPTSRLIFASEAVEVAGVSVSDPPPIVVVVFDEFPVASLIDEDGNLQSDLYPNFARLAQDGTWYRNAITVHGRTEFSVPTILTGKRSSIDQLPIAFDHPDNLFTLLGGAYEIHAVETLTSLCPESICDDPTRTDPPYRQRWTSLLSDLEIIAGHLFLPDDLTSSLPPIDQGWADFAEPLDASIEPVAGFSTRDDRQAIVSEEVQSIRGSTFEAYLRNIQAPDTQPTLDFIHVLLPHSPWEYFPNGQRYIPPRPIPGADGSGWGSDAWLTNQAYQLHLAQVQYVDRLIGQLITRLVEVGIYDEAIIVVTADHGISFRPNEEHRRRVTDANVGEIAAIPLFIKTSAQMRGETDDYRAETIDVLPTIVDALGIPSPWETHGTSLLADVRAIRNESTITKGGNVTFGVTGDEKRKVAAFKIDAFGDSGAFGLAPDGTADLLGVQLTDLEIGPSTPSSPMVEGLSQFVDVGMDEESVPALVRGTLLAPSAAGDQILAIAVNGTIAAITRTYRVDEDVAFYALLPPDSLANGRNEIDVVMIGGEAGARRYFAVRR